MLVDWELFVKMLWEGRSVEDLFEIFELVNFFLLSFASTCVDDISQPSFWHAGWLRTRRNPLVQPVLRGCAFLSGRVNCFARLTLWNVLVHTDIPSFGEHGWIARRLFWFHGCKMLAATLLLWEHLSDICGRWTQQMGDVGIFVVGMPRQNISPQPCVDNNLIWLFCNRWRGTPYRGFLVMVGTPVLGRSHISTLLACGFFFLVNSLYGQIYSSGVSYLGFFSLGCLLKLRLRVPLGAVGPPWWRSYDMVVVATWGARRWADVVIVGNWQECRVCLQPDRGVFDLLDVLLGLGQRDLEFTWVISIFFWLQRLSWRCGRNERICRPRLEMRDEALRIRREVFWRMRFEFSVFLYLVWWFVIEILNLQT